MRSILALVLVAPSLARPGNRERGAMHTVNKLRAMATGMRCMYNAVKEMKGGRRALSDGDARMLQETDPFAALEAAGTLDANGYCEVLGTGTADGETECNEACAAVPDGACTLPSGANYSGGVCSVSFGVDMNAAAEDEEWAEILLWLDDNEACVGSRRLVEEARRRRMEESSTTKNSKMGMLRGANRQLRLRGGRNSGGVCSQAVMDISRMVMFITQGGRRELKTVTRTNSRGLQTDYKLLAQTDVAIRMNRRLENGEARQLSQGCPMDEIIDATEEQCLQACADINAAYPGGCLGAGMTPEDECVMHFSATDAEILAALQDAGYCL